MTGSMSPRSMLALVGALALGALVVVAVWSATIGPPGGLVVAEVLSAAQDDEGYVRIDLRLRNEVGRRVDVLSTEGASFWWGGRRSSLESLRILSVIRDGEAVDAPFETVEQLPRIASSEACMVQLDVRLVEAESFLDHFRDRVAWAQIEVPVQLSSQLAR